MDKHFLGEITCVASDRLITDKNGEQFYECITQEELNAIQVNTDKDAIKSNLFYALGRMDAVLSAVVGQITKNRYVEIIFAIKDGGKSIALNISNDKSNGNEVMALGLIEIGVGIGIAILAPSNVVGVAAGLIISSLLSYFLADLYLYLKDKALYLWEQIKSNFDEATKTIASLVEQNIDSLQNFSSNLIDKISSWIDEFSVELQYNSAHPYANPQRNLESSNYKSLIELFLGSNSTAKDIDSLLHSFPHHLKKESKQEVYSPLSPQGISFSYFSITYLTTIKALKDTLKEYLPKAKKIVLYTPNPFVSLYTSSPFYIFNSNLSFFNSHLQYLLTSKDTQQWLYDTLFSLARDNREIIVYEWGWSVEDLKEKGRLDLNIKQSNFKDSKEYKERLESKDFNQSTNPQKQTSLKNLGSNFDSTLRVA